MHIYIYIYIYIFFFKSKFYLKIKLNYSLDYFFLKIISTFGAPNNYSDTNWLLMQVRIELQISYKMWVTYV